MQKHSQNAVEMARCYSKMKGTSDLGVYGIKGKEGDRTTYVAKLTFSQLAEHFDLVPNDESPEGVMLQRELAKSRSKAIATYITSNYDFIFPELIAVVEKVDLVEYEGFGNVVHISLLKEFFRYLVDGQGRLFAIKTILEANPDYSENTVDVKFVLSRGVESDSQVFTDINKNPVSPNASQCIAMDSREVISRFTKDAVKQIPELSQIVDYTKSSVTNNKKTSKVWTLNQVSMFIQVLTGCSTKKAKSLFSEEEQRNHWIDFMEKFFSKLRVNKQLDSVFDSGKEACAGTIIGSATLLKSMAVFGRVAIINMMSQGDGQVDWSFMDKLKDVDFSVKNPEWTGRCLNYRGKLEDKAFNHKAVASYLCEKTGLRVTEDLETVEEEVLLARAAIKRQQREEGECQPSFGVAS